jgi:hypothetical protein
MFYRPGAISATGDRRKPLGHKEVTQSAARVTP